MNRKAQAAVLRAAKPFRRAQGDRSSNPIATSLKRSLAAQEMYCKGMVPPLKEATVSVRSILADVSEECARLHQAIEQRNEHGMDPTDLENRLDLFRNQIPCLESDIRHYETQLEGACAPLARELSRTQSPLLAAHCGPSDSRTSEV